MENNDAALNPDWKQQIAKIGKANFMREEMLRLGFFNNLDPEKRRQAEAVIEATGIKLRQLRPQLLAIFNEIESSQNIEALIKEVRRLRIERVKQERIERKERQAREREERQTARRKKWLKTPGFLGVGVSGRLSFDDGDDQRLETNQLPVARNLQDLAQLMNVSEPDLLWLSYERAASSVDHYTRFEIPKRSGGKRQISSPKPRLRVAQRWISEAILDNLTPSPSATAFRLGSSIVKNATPHLHASVVVRMDVKDFFPSISFARVRGFFEHCGYNPGVATILALVCTDASRVKVTLDGKTQWVAVGERSLPQGACTSPALANLIASPMDRRIAGLIAKLDYQWRYTRYADDMTLSSADSSPNVGRLLHAIETIAKDEGFTLNAKKTAVMRAPNRQVVTGLVVGDRIRLSRKDLRRLRAFFHQCNRDGFSAVSAKIGADALSVARGHLSYLNMVMPELATRLKSEYHWL
ncbi:MAG: reverse transcriptase family protein [Tateyamaria sp.]|uniref:reverse transcriptase family protein n=1 Tax=Tateyamaria sp. TaxID=1929288 RepID=UPI00329C1626